MSTFIASKFDPENDKSRPKIGEIVPHEGQSYAIVEVSWVETSKILRELMKDGPTTIMDPKGHDLCLSQEHPTRPGVTWLVWLKKEESNEK